MKSPKIPILSRPQLILKQPYPIFFKDVYESTESNLLIRNAKYYIFQSPDSYRVFAENIEKFTTLRSEYEFSLERNPKTLKWLLDRPQTENLSYATFWSEVIGLYQRFSNNIAIIKENKATLFKDKSHICVQDDFVLSVAPNLIFLSRANTHQTNRYAEKSITITLDSFYEVFDKAVFSLFQPITSPKNGTLPF